MSRWGQQFLKYVTHKEERVWRGGMNTKNAQKEKVNIA
jgi:hypothetical protein